MPKISALPIANSAATGDLLVLDQSSITKRVDFNVLQSAIANAGVVQSLINQTLTSGLGGGNPVFSSLRVTGPVIFGSGLTVSGTGGFGINLQAANVNFTQSGTGAVPRTVQSKDRDVVSVLDFAANGVSGATVDPTGVLDSSGGFTAWAVAINTLGGAIAVIPPGTYNVTVPKNGILCSFANLNGLQLLCGGATIADQQTWSGTDTGILFQFSACNDFTVSRPKITCQNIGASSVIGTRGFNLIQGCRGFSIDFEQTGGLEGVQMNRAFTDPASFRCDDYSIRAVLTNCHYGVVGQFSGDNGKVQMSTSGGYRDFFFYGVSHVDIDINCKNPNGTSLINAASGFGCSDFGLNYHDRESTAHIDLPRVQLVWGDQTAAIHRDIRTHFDIANVAGSAGVPFFSFDKLTNAGGPDTTGRGHQLLGFEISGVSDTIAGCNHVGTSDISAMVLTGTPDVVQNIKVKDFICTGATVDDDWSFLAGALSDRMVFDHVNIGARSFVVGNGSNGLVVFKDCVAATFSVNRQNGGLPFGDTGNALVLLNKLTASASSSLDFTTGISADFPEYILQFENLVPGTDDSTLFFRVSEDSGSTFKAGGTDYAYEFNITADAATNTPVGSTGAANIQMTGGISGTAARGGVSGSVRSFTPSNTTQDKEFLFDNIYVRTVAASRNRVVGSGIFKLDTNAINGFRLIMSAGTIASGTASLYGRRAV